MSQVAAARARVRAPRWKFTTTTFCGQTIKAGTREELDTAITEHVARCEACVATAQDLHIPIQHALDLEARHGRS